MRVNILDVFEYLEKIKSKDWYDPVAGVGMVSDFLLSCLTLVWAAAAFHNQDGADEIRPDTYVPSESYWLGAIAIWGSPGTGKTMLGNIISKIFLERSFYPDKESWELVDDCLRHVYDPKYQIPKKLKEPGYVSWLAKEILENALIAGISGRLVNILKRTSFGRRFRVETHFSGVRVYNPTFVFMDPSTIEPVDVRGAVTLREDESGTQYSTTAVPVDFMPILRFPLGIFMIDDLPFGKPDVMTALRLIIQEGRIHSRDESGEHMFFPAGWRILITGNFPEQSTMAAEVPDVVRNRIVHLGIDVPEEFTDIVPRASQPRKEGDEKNRKKAAARLVLDVHMMQNLQADMAAFLIENRQYLRMEAADDRLASPTLRTLSYVSAIMKEYLWVITHRDLDPTQRAVLEQVVRACVFGAIGMEAADSFLKFAENVLALRVPRTPDILTMGAACISEEFMSQEDLESLQKAFSYSIKHWANAFYTALLRIERRLDAAGLLNAEWNTLDVRLKKERRSPDGPEEVVGITVFRSGSRSSAAGRGGSGRDGEERTPSADFSREDITGLENALEALMKILRRRMEAERRILEKMGVAAIGMNDMINRHVVEVGRRLQKVGFVITIAEMMSEKVSRLMDQLDEIIQFRMLLAISDEEHSKTKTARSAQAHAQTPAAGQEGRKERKKQG